VIAAGGGNPAVALRSMVCWYIAFFRYNSLTISQISSPKTALFCKILRIKPQKSTALLCCFSLKIPLCDSFVLNLKIFFLAPSAPDTHPTSKNAQNLP
jgi:hypothetical protein